MVVIIFLYHSLLYHYCFFSFLSRVFRCHIHLMRSFGSLSLSLFLSLSLSFSILYFIFLCLCRMIFLATGYMIYIYSTYGENHQLCLWMCIRNGIFREIFAKISDRDETSGRKWVKNNARQTYWRCIIQKRRQNETHTCIHTHNKEKVLLTAIVFPFAQFSALKFGFRCIYTKSVHFSPLRNWWRQLNTSNKNNCIEM